MRLIPTRINTAWIGTLADADLIDIEARLHERFNALDQRQKRASHGSYTLMRAPSDVIDAWDRWSRVNGATRARALVPRVLK